MPNATRSQVGIAQEMTLNVKDGLTQIAEDMRAGHEALAQVNENLHTLLDDSHNSGVSAMIDQVETAAAALERAVPLVEEGANKAVEIEAGI